jgi:2-dehydro-3-deoxyphosphogluconate aldolase/(4S)-4-hydroxy-2-oxoglutarate aldolase
MTDSVLDTLAAERVVGILRYHQSGDIKAAIEALGAGGVRILEITIDGPNAWDALAWAAATGRFAVGAGTVIRAEDVRRVAQAGARFIVTPGFVPEVVETAIEIGITAIPGIATATEALAARRAGAQALKLFPAAALGVHYLRDLLGPFHGVPFVPTGGLGPANVREWLDAGALAVGLGAALVGGTAPSTPAEVEALRQRAAEAVRQARGSR